MSEANQQKNLKPDELRELILNTLEPIVLRKFETNWTCFKGTLNDWCTSYDESLQNSKRPTQAFEQISKTENAIPQWERLRNKVNMTGKEFLEVHSQKQDFWSALNYKRTYQLPASCTEGIDFNCFGFNDAKRDFTFWLGSEGSNTPCHYDTYGCNIIVQIYGRKSWLLFPPGIPHLLTPTRIPYEESSIYSLENLYAPSADSLPSLMKLLPVAHHCILEPQDVLIVPPRWWHFVEALENSLSVNYWVPLRQDLFHLLDEIIVKYLIERFVKTESEDVKNYVLNPSEKSDETKPEELLDLYEHVMEFDGRVPDNVEYLMDGRTYYPFLYRSQNETDALLQRQPNAEVLKPMSTKNQLENLLKENSKRHKMAEADELKHRHCPLTIVQETLINSVCAPHVIRSTRKEFFRRRFGVEDDHDD